MTLDNTVWPERQVPHAVKDWLEEFFAAAMISDPSGTDRLVECLADDAITTNMNGSSSGKQGGNKRSLERCQP